MIDDWAFVDTNILVYAYDITAEEKHKTAVEIITGLWETGKGIISTQVLQEFYVTVVHKIPYPIDEEKAASIIRDMLNWKLVVNDGFTILEAISIQKRYQLSFWDSLILEAAISGGANILLSEDLSHQQIIENIQIKNPFLDKID